MQQALNKKVGEVLGFSRYSATFFAQEEEILREAWERQALAATMKKHTACLEKLEQTIKTHGIGMEKRDTAAKTATETLEKLKRMEGIYLHGEEEATELLEWLGFIAGASAVHARLVADMAREERLADLKKIAKRAQKLHEETLEQIISTIGETGNR